MPLKGWMFSLCLSAFVSYATYLYVKVEQYRTGDYKKISIQGTEVTIAHHTVGKEKVKCIVHRQIGKIVWSKCYDVQRSEI